MEKNIQWDVDILKKEITKTTPEVQSHEHTVGDYYNEFFREGADYDQLLHSSPKTLPFDPTKNIPVFAEKIMSHIQSLKLTPSEKTERCLLLRLNIGHMENKVLAAELTQAIEKQWFDLITNENVTKLDTMLLAYNITEYTSIEENPLKLNFVMSLLNSGITFESDITAIKEASREIAERREAFKKRPIFGPKMNAIFFNYENIDGRLNCDHIASFAQQLGTTVLSIHPNDNYKEQFLNSIAQSPNNIPLTIVYTGHGVAAEGGYLDLSLGSGTQTRKIRITPEEFANSLLKRGNTGNVTILTTQCEPRSFNFKNSFYDQVIAIIQRHSNHEKHTANTSSMIPAIYMESYADQPGIILREPTKGKQFQTLGLMSAFYQKTLPPNKTILGNDLLRVTPSIIGNFPALILPPHTTSSIPLTYNLSAKKAIDSAT